MVKLLSKEWWKSKTMWLNVLAIALGVGTAIQADLQSGVVITAGGVFNIIIRVYTNTQIKK